MLAYVGNNVRVLESKRPEFIIPVEPGTVQCSNLSPGRNEGVSELIKESVSDA